MFDEVPTGSSSFTIKYSNPGFSTSNTYTVSQIQCQKSSSQTTDFSATVDVPTADANYMVIHVTPSSLSSASLYKINVQGLNGNGISGTAIVINFVTAGYYIGTVDLSSSSTQSVTVDADAAGTKYMRITGTEMDAAPTITDLPEGVTFTAATGATATLMLNSNMMRYAVGVNKEVAQNGTYHVTATVGTQSYQFDLVVTNAVSPAPVVPTFDQEITTTESDKGSIYWDLHLNGTIRVKINVPEVGDTVIDSIQMTYNSGSGTSFDNSNVVLKLVQFNADEEYVVVELQNKSITSSTSTNNVRNLYLRSSSMTTPWNSIPVRIVGYDTTASVISSERVQLQDWVVEEDDDYRIYVSTSTNLEQDQTISCSLKIDGVNQDLQSVITADVRYYSAGGYLSVSLAPANDIVSGRYELSVPLGGTTYSLVFDVVSGSVYVDNSRDYIVSIDVNDTLSTATTLRLDLNIESTQNAAQLSDMRLLFVAKYSGGYVFNFYSKPEMVGGTGVDAIVLTSTNLVSVIVEVVDGFQSGNPIYYGFSSYVP